MQKEHCLKFFSASKDIQKVRRVLQSDIFSDTPVIIDKVIPISPIIAEPIDPSNNLYIDSIEAPTI